MAAAGGDKEKVKPLPRNSQIEATRSLAWSTKAWALRGKLTNFVMQNITEKGGKNGPLVQLFSGYKKVLFRSGHLVLTWVVFFHFGYIKFEQQDAAVPSGAPNYWWKRLVPPIEFGFMHAILFQIALIPLTMCKCSLSYLSQTSLGLLIPFEQITDLHIFMGYVFCIVMILSTILFFVFFGKVCADHNNGLDPAKLCEKFESEIFIVGLVILAVTLVVMASSFFRGRIKFEVFYFLHHLVFAMYSLATLHTLDSEFRAETKVGKARSQTWKWFVGSLAIYAADRLWRSLSSRRVRVISTTASQGVLVLHLEKPSSFHFAPGQYACLKVAELDITCHPFSISSAPSASRVSFVIEVKEPGSWTARLVDWLQDSGSGSKGATIDLSGPYGTPVTSHQFFDSVVAVGTGTGIVPMLSLVMEHGHRLTLLKKHVWMESQQQHNAGKGNAVELSTRFLQLWVRTRSVERGGRQSPYIRSLLRESAKRQLNRNINCILSILLLLADLWLLTTMVSWSNMPAQTPITPGMAQTLRGATLGITLCFGLYSLHLFYMQGWKPAGLEDVVNLQVMIASIAFWFAWFDEGNWSAATNGQQILWSVFSLWRLARTWYSSPACPRNTSGQLGRQLLPIRTMELVWACRSATLARGYLQVFTELLEDLRTSLDVSAAGLEKFLRLRIHCTDRDQEACRSLCLDLNQHPLQSNVSFKRPRLQELIMGMMQDHIRDGLTWQESTSSLVTFCGSKEVARECRSHVQHANHLAGCFGASHVCLFKEEFYGLVGGKGSSPAAPAPNGDFQERSSIVSI